MFDICSAREYVKGIALFSLIEIIATRKRKKSFKSMFIRQSILHDKKSVL